MDTSLTTNASRGIRDPIRGEGFSLPFQESLMRVRLVTGVVVSVLLMLTGSARADPVDEKALIVALEKMGVRLETDRNAKGNPVFSAILPTAKESDLQPIISRLAEFKSLVEVIGRNQ